MTATDRAASLALAYAHGPGKTVRPGPTPLVDAPPTQRLHALTELAGMGTFGAALVRLIFDVLSPQRWEPWNRYNEHRAYPSARSAFLTQPHLMIGGSRLVIDPVRRAFAGGLPRELGDHARIGVVRVPERITAGYGSLRDALAELEAGHLIGGLVEHAAAIGLAAVADRSGVDLAPRAGARPAVPALAPFRTAGLGPLGLSADPRPVPVAAVDDLIATFNQPPQGSPAAARRLRHYVALRNIDGRAAGWYEAGATEPFAPGEAMQQVQAAFGYAREQMDVASMNVAWLMTGDVAAAVNAYGAVGYLDLLVEAGAAAQHLCVTAARHGLFARPVRSVREESLEAAARVSAYQDFVYLVLMGRSRAAGFSYDLSPLEDPK